MRTFFLLLMLSLSSLSARDATLLWPSADATPHAEGDAETDLPRAFYYPAEEPTGATIVICPGGGYGGLAADHEGHQIAQFFNNLGVDAWVVHYRLGKQGYHYPTQLADVQRAIRLARSQARDPYRVGVIGFSAGGHLASMASTLYDEAAYETSDMIDEHTARPDFAVLCYPVISMEKGVTHGGSRKNLLGPDRSDDDAFATKLSSEQNVTEDTPPTFIFQTDEDAAVPAENALHYTLALREHGVPCELHLYQRGVHGVGLYPGDPILSTWSGHLADWLRSNGILARADFERVSVKGVAELNGTPISWGSVTFHPEDDSLPRTTARIRNGRFAADAESGPVAGKSRITFAGSVWEATQDPADGVELVDSGLTVELPSDGPLNFALNPKKPSIE